MSVTQRKVSLADEDVVSSKSLNQEAELETQMLLHEKKLRQIKFEHQIHDSILEIKNTNRLVLMLLIISLTLSVISLGFGFFL